MAVSEQIARLQRRLERIPQEVRASVEPTLDRNAQELVDLMRYLAPDDPATNAPDLKSSIRYELGQLELSRRVFTDDVNALWQEYGTSKMEANPFFGIAVSLLPSALTTARNEIAKAVKAYWGGR